MERMNCKITLQPFKVLHYCLMVCGIDLIGPLQGYRLWILRVYRVILMVVQLLVTYTTTAATVDGFSSKKSMSELSIALAGCVHMFCANTIYYIVVLRSGEIRNVTLALMDHMEKIAVVTGTCGGLVNMRQKLRIGSWVLCTFVVLYCCSFLSVAQYAIFGGLTKRFDLLRKNNLAIETLIKSLQWRLISSALTFIGLAFATVGFTMFLLVLFIMICLTLDRMFSAFNEAEMCSKMPQSSMGLRQVMKCHDATCQLVRTVEYIFSPIIFLCIVFGCLGVGLQIRSVLLDMKAGVNSIYYFQFFMYLIFFLVVWMFAARLNSKMLDSLNVFTTFPNDMNNNMVTEELALYLLLFETCRVELSAWGYFAVNKGHFIAALGTMASYLIMLFELN